jgi:hypothetical protein
MSHAHQLPAPGGRPETVRYHALPDSADAFVLTARGAVPPLAALPSAAFAAAPARQGTPPPIDAAPHARSSLS